MDLPITARKDEFLCLYKMHPVIVVEAETGSGKTTQIPRWISQIESEKVVACTQPRRIAATSVAKYVAGQAKVKLGEEVGYHVRYGNRTSDKTRLVYMTDGILLAEYSGDKNLSKYSCIILDEAHDRTLNTDLLMAFLKAMIQSRRKDLTIVIMSATINAPMFQKYFMDAPLFSVEGRTHPVQIEYLSEVTDSVVNTAACVVLDILKTSSKGDILVFLSGEDEVEGLCAILRRYGDKNLLLMPLYSALSKVEQNNVFKRIEDGARKCVVATNIAEASITIGGIAYVVDSGLMKQTRYDYRIGMSMLQKTTVSKAAANQRAGRAARAQPGKCVRLYTEECYNKFRPSTLPSIHCQDLKSVCLKVLSNCSGSILNFDFIERPPIEGLLCAIRDLQDMGYVTGMGKITLSGKTAADIPAEPAWCYAIEAAKEYQMEIHVLTLAAIASNQKSIFWRPHARRYVADAVHQQWRHPLSDHIGQLEAYYAWTRVRFMEPKVDASKWAKDHMLSQHALEEVAAVRTSLLHAFSRAKGPRWLKSPEFNTEIYTNLRKSLAVGLCFNTAMKKDKGEIYCTIHGNQSALISPDSGLVDAQSQWVVYNNFTVGAKPYLHTVTAIDPAWIEALPYFQDSRMPKNYTGTTVRQHIVKSALDKIRKQ